MRSLLVFRYLEDLFCVLLTIRIASSSSCCDQYGAIYTETSDGKCTIIDGDATSTNSGNEALSNCQSSYSSNAMSTVTSAADLSALTSAASGIAGNEKLFIGLRNLDNTSDFVFDDGTALTFASWAADEPSTTVSIPSCVYVDLTVSPSSWYAVGCDDVINATSACQKDCPTDNCLSSPCTNGATCMSSGTDYTCTCIPGYTGINCEEDIDACASSPCLNSGQCHDNVNAFMCACGSGFYGLQCEFAQGDCATGWVQLVAGKCYAIVEGPVIWNDAQQLCGESDGQLAMVEDAQTDTALRSYTLSQALPSAFIGLQDTTLGNPGTLTWLDGDSLTYQNWAVNDTVAANAFCTLFEADPTTTATWHKIDCDTTTASAVCFYDATVCNSQPCQNGGTCAQLVGNYSCDCASGYTGINCDQDIDECESLPCHNGGACNDQVDGYTCTCASPFAGIFCELGQGVCDPGWIEAGVGVCYQLHNVQQTWYQALDTCSANISQLAIIHDADTDAALRSLALAAGVEFQIGLFDYSNITGEYYWLDGSGLNYTNWIDSNNSTFASPNFCVRLNPNIANSWTPEDCDTATAAVMCYYNAYVCDSLPCMYNGTCSTTHAGFMCNCTANYTGYQCEALVNSCDSNPCQNDFPCVSLGIAAGYYCNCSSFYTGVNCEIPQFVELTVAKCYHVPNMAMSWDDSHAYCQDQGGTLATIVDTAAESLLVSDGIANGIASFYIGASDSSRSTPPSSTFYWEDGSAISPAVANWSAGSYPSTQNTYWCSMIQTGLTDPSLSSSWLPVTCSDTVAVAVCQRNCTPNCDLWPCQNGGTCTEGLNDYVCTCALGFTGVNCETIIDNCVSDPCQNGATCINQINSYSCQCWAGYTGFLCETEIDECQSQPCENGATCIDGVDNYVCQCTAEYTDVNCATVLTSSSTTTSTAVTSVPETSTNVGTSTTVGTSELASTNQSPTSEMATDVSTSLASQTSTTSEAPTNIATTTSISPDSTTFSDVLTSPSSPLSSSSPSSSSSSFSSSSEASASSGETSESFSQPSTVVSSLASSLATTTTTMSPMETSIITSTSSSITSSTVSSPSTITDASYSSSSATISSSDIGSSTAVFTTTSTVMPPSVNATSAFLNTTASSTTPSITLTPTTVTTEPTETVISTSSFTSNATTFVTQISSQTSETMPSKSSTVSITDPLVVSTIETSNTGTSPTVLADSTTKAGGESDATLPTSESTNTVVVTTTVSQSNTALTKESTVNDLSTMLSSVDTATAESSLATKSSAELSETTTTATDSLPQSMSTNEPTDSASTTEVPESSTATVDGSASSSATPSSVSSTFSGITSTTTTLFATSATSGASTTPEDETSSEIQTTITEQASSSLANILTSTTTSVSTDSIESSTLNSASTFTVADNTSTTTAMTVESSDTTITSTVDSMIPSTTTLTTSTLDPISCNSNPCQNNGKCYNIKQGSYVCLCQAGFSGINCEIKLPACYSNPCQNGGQCTGSDSFTCQCADGYEGIVCGIKSCPSNPCMNGGTCSEVGDSFVCICPILTTGTLCEQRLPTCSSHPCQNGGNCTGDLSSYQCQCRAGIVGSNCETNINECASVVCQNGGTCVDEVDQYYCSCMAGFLGSFCETDIDECASNPCNNRDLGATCLNLANHFQCLCTGNFTGDTCTFDPASVAAAAQLVAPGGALDQVSALQQTNNTIGTGALLADALPYLAASMPEDVRINMSWSYDDTFTWATYEGNQLNIIDDFLMWNDPLLGNCFTFNHMNKSQHYMLHRIGVNYGLRARLILNLDEYVSWTTTAGFRIFVHDPNETVFMESISFEASPGYTTSIVLQRSIVTRLREPYGLCTASKYEIADYFFDGVYTTEGCIRTCYQKELMKQCGCMDPRYNGGDGDPFCGIENRTCVDQFNADDGNYLNWPSCVCNTPCVSMDFDATVFRTSFRSQPTECDFSNITASAECSQNYQMDTVIMEVYFSTLAITYSQETPSFTFAEMLSKLGGSSGVLYGLSIVTGVEFMWVLFQMVFTFITGRFVGS